MPNETISQIQLPNGTTYDIVGKVTISRNLTSGTKSATINIDGTDYDIYSVTNTDTKLKTSIYTPSQLVVFPIFGDSISSSAEEKYISYGFMGKEYNNEFGLFLGAGGSSDTGYLWLNKGNYGTTLYADTSLSANRTIYLPNADGTIALTSNIPSAYTSTPSAPGTGSAGSSTSYSKGDHVHPKELPTVSSSDNDKVLMVSNGAWAAGTFSGLPSVSSSDNGKVLTVVSGAWAAASLPLYNGGVS